MTWLVRVDCPPLCFGFEVRDGVVTAGCAPVAAWMIGRAGRAMVAYWRRRGAQVAWQPWTKGEQ